MTGPINPDREQQQADNRASRRQSHIGPLPAELMDEEEKEEERNDGGKDADAAAGSDTGAKTKSTGD